MINDDIARKIRSKCEIRTSTPSEEAADADEGDMSSTLRPRKRKIARAKKAMARRKSKAKNQFCCQNGKSEGDCDCNKLLLAVVVDDDDDVFLL